MPTPIPLVIDTDPGIDDALAILLALASPEVDLRLVTTVHGNVELAQTTENALRVLHLAGRSDVPVAAGARESLVHPQPERAGHVHGAAGLGGVELPPSAAVVDPRPAVVALAELLLTLPEPVTVAAVGPLTNIALLLRVFPEAAARIGRLVVMGGSAARGGNVTAAAEFNVWADPEAAQAVLTSALPTLLVGLDVTLPTVLDEDGIARFAAAGPIGTGRRRSCSSTSTTPGSPTAPPGSSSTTPWPSPRRSCRERSARCAGTSSSTPGLGAGRGQTLVDRRSVSAAPTAVEVAERVDSAAAVEFLVSRLASLDRRLTPGRSAGPVLRGGLHDAERDVPQLAVVALGGVPQDLEGLLGVHVPLGHQHALGLLDHRTRLHGHPHVAGLVGQLGVRVGVGHRDRDDLGDVQTGPQGLRRGEGARLVE